jgi:arsenite-transporting ATPase
VRVILVSGKGGVGKTSLALATALGAAEHGHRVAVLSTDAAHSLGDALGRPVGPDAVEVADRVEAREVSALVELDRSWEAIRRFYQTLLFSDADELVAEELLVLPGFEELVALRAVKEVEDGGAHDVCIVDCAPTAATLRMLRLPDILRHFMENVFGWKRRSSRMLRPMAKRIGVERFIPPEEFWESFEQLYAGVEAVRQILLDESRTSARLVTNPTRVVVDETRRAFSYLCLHGIATDALLVNRVLPPEATGGYFGRWAEHERRELADIERSFPVAILKAPLRPREPIGVDALRALGEELYGERDPADAFVQRRPIRLERRDGQTRLAIDLPTACSDEIDVVVRGDELLVGVRDVERRIALPASLAGRAVTATEHVDGVLEITFAAGS